VSGFAIKDAFEEGVPRCYTPDVFTSRAGAVFQHVYERYGLSARPRAQRSEPIGGAASRCFDAPAATHLSLGFFSVGNRPAIPRAVSATPTRKECAHLRAPILEHARCMV
jgi:hypothetical protein